MRLLKDDELFHLVDPSNPDRIIRDFPPRADWYTQDSPVQPSSIDLNIGNIFLPGKNVDEPGGQVRPLAGHTLKRGGTAVVETREEIRLPGNIAGIGFPPSRVSLRGILMTNPGHIDPGYAGRMYFTVINMGKQDYVLRRDEVIVTVLLVQLSGDVRMNWLSRRQVGQAAVPPIQEVLHRLSADFMDIDTRAADISTKTSAEAVKNAELSIKYRQVAVPIIVAIITALGSLWLTWAKPTWKEPIEEIKRDMAVLRASLDLRDMKSRLDKVERLLKGTKEAPRSGGASQGARPQDILRKGSGTVSGHGQ